MCPICGGACGGTGDAVIAAGIPFLAVGYWKFRGYLKKIKDQFVK